MLRSLDKITGYSIDATDGNLGIVHGFLVEDHSWIIRCHVIDTRKWLPGRRTPISPNWVDRFGWDDKLVYVDLDRETIRRSPEFHPDVPISREFETRLHDYYGRPKYRL